MPAPRLVVVALLAAACLSCSAPASTPPPPSAALVDATGAPVPTLGADARVADLGFLTLDLLDIGVTPVAGYAEPLRGSLADGLGDDPAAAAVRVLPPALSPAFDVLTEQVVALRPDVVVTTSAYAQAFEAALDKLRGAVPVVVLDGGAGWRERSQFLGRLLHRETEAAAAQQRTVDAIAAGRTALASRAGATVSILRLGATEVGGNLEAYVPPSLPAQVVTDLGLGRPAAQQVAGADGQPPVLSRIAVSTEQLTVHDADLIVDLEVGGMTNPGAVTTSPLWQRLGAVRSGHIVTASYLVWSVPSTVSVRRMVAQVVGGLNREGTR